MGFEEGLVKGFDDLVFVLTHENSMDPTTRHVAFVFRNYTSEMLHYGGFAGYDHATQVFPPRSVPTTISPRSNGGWVVQTDPGQEGSIEGSVWFKIGNGTNAKGDANQINIDFKNLNLHTTNWSQVYTNNDQRYAVHISITNDLSANCEVKLAYNRHDTKLQGTRLRDSPAAIRQGNSIRTFFQGDNDNGTLYSNSMSCNNTWTRDSENEVVFPGNQRAWINAHPSVVDYSNRLFLFYQGRNDQRLWNAWYDGGNPAGNCTMNAKITCSPCAAVYANVLHVFYQEGGNTGRLLFQKKTGASGSWDGEYIVKDASMSESPSVVEWNGKLYIFFQGPNHNGELRYVCWENGGWSAVYKVNNVGISGSPAAVVVNNQIRIYHHGFGDNGTLWYYDMQGKDGDVPVVGIGMSYSPTPLVMTNKVTVLHHGSGGNKELWAVDMTD